MLALPSRIACRPTTTVQPPTPEGVQGESGLGSAVRRVLTVTILLDGNDRDLYALAAFRIWSLGHGRLKIDRVGETKAMSAMMKPIHRAWQAVAAPAEKIGAAAQELDDAATAKPM